MKNSVKVGPDSVASCGKIRLVFISHAGIRQINRVIYRHIAAKVDEVQIVVPEFIYLSSGKKLFAEPAVDGDPVVVKMALSGKNPRTYFYPELINWLDQVKPTAIILENDPVSRLGHQLARWCSINHSRLFCQAYENLHRDPVSTMKNQSVKYIPTNLAIHCLHFLMARRISGVFVVNKDSEGIFTNYGYRLVSRIPLGYSTAVFYDDERRKVSSRQSLGVGPDVVLVSYFGRLVKEKGVDLLLAALAELKHLPWMFLLDYKHDHHDQFAQQIDQSIVSLGLKDRVIYFEADHFQIADYMRAADIMVAPSLSTTTFKEQYGRTVQEAMACGCVTLVSDSGHLKDLVGHQDLIFAQGNGSELTQRLSELIAKNDLRQELRSFLRQRAVSLLTCERQAEDMLHEITNYK